MAVGAAPAAELSGDAGGGRAVARGFPGTAGHDSPRVSPGPRGLLLAFTDVRRGLLPRHMVERRGGPAGRPRGRGAAGALGSGDAARNYAAFIRELVAQPLVS